MFFRNKDESPDNCIFCGIVAGGTSDTVVYKDDEIAAFHDIRPAAEMHILVVPIAHVVSVKNLEGATYEILEKMKLKGEELLKSKGYDPNDLKQSRMGFHVPPFNTVNHLHLHVLGGKFKGGMKKKKYEEGRMWYLSMNELLKREKPKSIGQVVVADARL